MVNYISILFSSILKLKNIIFKKKSASNFLSKGIDKNDVWISGKNYSIFNFPLDGKTLKHIISFRTWEDYVMFPMLKNDATIEDGMWFICPLKSDIKEPSNLPKKHAHIERNVNILGIDFKWVVYFINKSQAMYWINHIK